LRRRRTGEVHHGVDGPGHFKRPVDVLLQELEPGAAHQVGDVVWSAGAEIIDSNDLVATLEEQLSDMRSEEASSSGDDDPHATLSRSSSMWWRSKPCTSSTLAGTAGAFRPMPW